MPSFIKKSSKNHHTINNKDVIPEGNLLDLDLVYTTSESRPSSSVTSSSAKTPLIDSQY
jgi:hypothetical protein